MLVGIPFAILLAPCPLEHSNSCFAFDCISFFVAFFIFHYYPCVPGNIATFHIVEHLELTIMVNDLGMTLVFKQCLWAMFLFQLGSLHISKDVLYDFNNLVLNLLCQIPMTSFQGK
jgi:hypothetical protein